MIVLVLFTVGVLRIQGVQLIVVHMPDNSTVSCGGDMVDFGCLGSNERKSTS